MQTLYTIKEVANTLKVSVATIRSWIFYKKIKFIKVGNSVRIQQEELDRLMKGE